MIALYTYMGTYASFLLIDLEETTILILILLKKGTNYGSLSLFLNPLYRIDQRFDPSSISRCSSSSSIFTNFHPTT